MTTSDLLRGIILAYCFTKLIYPSESKGIPLIYPTINHLFYKGSCVVSLNKKTAVHLHHWILSSICMICILLFKKKQMIVHGFLLGMIIHGLSYDDRFEIICENPYNLSD